MRRYLFGIVAITLSLQYAYADHATLPDGVTPVMATWLWGYHTVPASITKDGYPRLYAYPHTDANRINDPPWTEVAARDMKAGARVPAMLWLHGCDGMPRGSVGYRVYFMSKGYALFEPDSFARPGHRCDDGNVPKRREEISHAFEQISELSWIDQGRIILVGISEGGRTVVGWEKPGFAAHIILMAGCRWGDRFIRAPAGIPLLAIMGGDDEYFAGYPCEVTRQIGGSRSIVIPGAPHDIMDRREVRKALDVFLKECCQ